MILSWLHQHPAAVVLVGFLVAFAVPGWLWVKGFVAECRREWDGHDTGGQG